uniref:Immunoglobulin domain-containing protein n=1 Tax=Oreochromis aureus TaxID=47969 RepID=A0AAZ1X4E0_OREAU
MWSLQNLLFILCISLRCVTSAVGVLNVTGYLRREVNISCPYDPGYESYEKYLCKDSCGRGDVLITTTNPVTYKYRTHDDKTARIFTTTISDLRSMDAGKYWCGVKKFLKDIYTEVKLKLVKEFCCVKSTKINGTVGHPLTLQCPYPSQHRDNRKFLCKGDQHNSCMDMTNQSRFTVHDNVSSSSFWVIIAELEAADAGTYWCGSDSQWKVGNYTKMELSVLQQTLGTLEANNPALYVVYIITPVLLLMCALFIVYKYRCSTVKGDEATGRNARNKL